jgi:streptogramin lyase
VSLVVHPFPELTLRPSLTILCWLAMLASPSMAGKIDTFAGSGLIGSSGDGSLAKLASLDQPFHCEFDPQGNLLIADAGAGKVRRVDRETGRISTIAGNGANGLGVNGSPALEATIGTPYAIAADKNGDLYIVDQKTPVVRKLDAQTGRVSIFAGTGRKGSSGDGGPASKAMLREPNDCVLDDKGGLLIADVGDWKVRRVDLKSGIITTFAGKGKPAGGIPPRSRIGDGGKAVDAVIVGARGVCIDGRGNTYLCEREGNAIRKVDESGRITTIAGTGASGYSGDGAPATLATFRGPKGIRADSQGNLFVVDTENHAIRKVDAKTGLVTTVAGGRSGSGGDGGPARSAGLARPHGCIVAPDGTIFIADSDNHRVGRVLPD